MNPDYLLGKSDRMWNVSGHRFVLDRNLRSQSPAKRSNMLYTNLVVKNQTPTIAQISQVRGQQVVQTNSDAASVKSEAAQESLQQTAVQQCVEKSECQRHEEADVTDSNTVWVTSEDDEDDENWVIL